MPSRKIQLLYARLAAWATPALIGWFGLATTTAGALGGYLLTEHAGRAQLAALAGERLELYASTLEAELARYAHLPSLVAIDSEVLRLLSPAKDAEDAADARRSASRRLARLNARSGTILMAVTDADGLPMASSSQVMSPASAGDKAQRMAWPAEVHQAIRAGLPGFFAPGPEGAGMDYFHLQQVGPGGGGARVVVKLSLAPLEATWADLGLRTGSEKLLVLDEQDQIMMSSVPAWRRRELLWQDGGETPVAGKAQAADSPLRVVAGGPRPEGAAAVVVRGVSDGTGRGEFLAQSREIVPLGVRLMTLSDLSEVRRTARYAAWGGALGGAFVGVLTLYLLHRRRAIEQVTQARNALQKAHDELERQVDQRTAELRSTNDELKRQVAQRIQAEDELMQAGKLAVLGQMSAGISHEVNQPLTALRALSRNTLLLLEAGRHQSVAGNLRAIDEMAERMGRIVGQLKSFARKAGEGGGPVPLALAVRNVLMLLEHRWRGAGVEIEQDLPEDLTVRGDIHRLEQVLVNLVGNALDAMEQMPRRHLRLMARCQAQAVEDEAAGEATGEEELGLPDALTPSFGADQQPALPKESPCTHVLLSIHDSGPGVPEELMSHLFEPFFTTKPAGQGLGLGLVISAKIIKEMGGQLRARRGETGMVFEVELPAMAREVGPSVSPTG